MKTSGEIKEFEALKERLIWGFLWVIIVVVLGSLDTI